MLATHVKSRHSRLWFDGRTAAFQPAGEVRFLHYSRSTFPQLSAQSKVITLSINGETRRFTAPLNVAELVDQLAYTGKRIALERNGEIVPRSTFATQQLADGDQLEVVVAVGGG